MPTGRAVPAAFDRADGKFLYYHLQKNGHYGGAELMAAGEFFFNGGLACRVATGEVAAKIGVGVTARLPLDMGVVHAAGNKLTAFRWIKKEEVDRKGVASTATRLEEHFSLDTDGPVLSLLVAGTRVAIGGRENVSLVDLDTKKRLASAKIDGGAYGLAAANGRLYVSTDTGAIHCFGAHRLDPPPVIRETPVERPYGDNELYARAASEIIEESGVTAGYCVDLGAGAGALAFELATRTDLFIYAVVDDPESAATARSRLRAAGLYGSRVVVHERALGRDALSEALRRSRCVGAIHRLRR